MVKVIFVWTKDNKADPFTKNPAGKDYWTHHGDYMLDFNFKKEEQDYSMQEGC